MGFKELKQKFFPLDNDLIDDEIGVVEDQDFIDGGHGVGNDSSERFGGLGRNIKAGVPSDMGSGVKVASKGSLEMKVVSPTKYEAVTQIADILLEGKTVLLNLENTNKETAKRLIDFLSGVAYALGGDIQKVADNTFAVTPNNVAVSNENVDAGYALEETEDQYE